MEGKTDKKGENMLQDTDKILVCDKCKTSACWRGLVMCADSDIAGTMVMTVAALRKLGLEHPNNWILQLHQLGFIGRPGE